MARSSATAAGFVYRFLLPSSRTLMHGEKPDLWSAREALVFHRQCPSAALYVPPARPIFSYKRSLLLAFLLVHDR